MGTRNQIIAGFAELGCRMEAFGADPALDGVLSAAMAENPWFTRDDILRAAGTIRETMLREELLSAWLDRYPTLPVRKPRRVGVIAAGNIPLVGFFDLLCVLVSGHTCCIKPSSKDRTLMRWVVGTLRGIDPELRIEALADGTTPDAVIATGSDNTNRYFRILYKGIPAVLRGNRTSAAMLTGRETPEQLAGLADDTFAYSGLGCRNVSHLLVPLGYDPATLAAALSAHGSPHPRYTDNYRQRRAVLSMQGERFTDGGFFLLRASEEPPAALSEITYRHYDDPAEAERWLENNDAWIQCVSAGSGRHPRRVDFGRAQRPALGDFPDGVDLLDFLAKI